MRTALRHAVTATLAAAAAVLLAGCGKAGGSGGPPAMPPPAVNVAVALKRPITEWDEFTGRIEAVESVELRPRVTGYLEAIRYAQGGTVKAGDVLFEIDDREYRAAYARAEADVQRAQSRVDLARRELERGNRMVERKLMAQDQVDMRGAELRQAQADLAAARAAADAARIDLEFCLVRSPIDGRAGKAEVTVGNLVTDGMPEATLLTTVVSIDPVYVSFEGDEQVYLKYQSMARRGERPSSRDERNPVRVGLANEDGYPHQGTMEFVDNQLDPSTGTIRARAVIENDDGYLTPGLFARIQLLGSGTREAVLINDRAIMTDQDRKFVWVIGPGNAALRRDVVPGPEVEGLRVIDQGLAGGESVIVNGVQKVFFPGMPVAPKVVPMDQPEGAPAPAPAPAPAAP